MIGDLIGKQWAIPCDGKTTFDCWELAVEARRRLGLPTHPYRVPPEARTLHHKRDLATPDTTLWRRLDGPQEGCLVGFGGRVVRHVGVYFNRKVLHATKQQGVAYQSVDKLTAFFGPVSFWEVANGDD